MKLSSIFGQSGYRTPLLSYTTLVILFVVMSVWRCATSGVVECGDSFSYYTAWYMFTHGLPDLYRTPLYPLVIGSLDSIFGHTIGARVTVLLQYSLYLVAARYLRLMALRVTRSPKASFWIVAYFLLWPGCTGYNNWILTEPFAVAGTIFMSWFLIKSLPALPSPADAIRAGVWMMFLILLRPIFIIVLPLAVALYAVAWWRSRKSHCRRAIVTPLVMLLLNGALVGGYTQWMHANYGIRTMSFISTVNNYFLLRQAHVHEPDIITDPRTRAVVDRLHSERGGNNGHLEWGQVTYTVPLANPGEFELYVNHSLRSHPGRVARVLGYRLVKGVFVTDFNGDLDDTFGWMMPPMLYYYLAMAVIVALWVAAWIRTRRFPLTSAYLIALTLAFSLTAWIGAMSQWARLPLPGNFAFYLLLGQAVSLLSVRVRPDWAARIAPGPDSDNNP